MLILSAALIVVAVVRGTPVPSNSSCSSPPLNTTIWGGTCQEYQGPCALYVGSTIFVPTNDSITAMQTRVNNNLRQAVQNTNILGLVGELMTEQFSCLSGFLGCTPAPDGSGEGIPQAYCDSACVDLWKTCNTPDNHYALDAYMQFSLPQSSAGLQQSTLTYCVSDISPYESSVSMLKQFPQKPDVWGGRYIPGGYPYAIGGLVGTPIYPVSTYSYTLTSGKVISNLQCKPGKAPGVVTQHVNLGLITCQSPSINVNGTCQLPCPYPVYDTDDLTRVGQAFAIPGIIGVVLCFFVLLDSIFVIILVTGGNSKQCLRKYLRTPGMSKQTGSSMFMSGDDSPTSGSNSSNTTQQKSQLHASTLYALLGAVLGIIYFFLGPFVTLTQGYEVMCDGPTIDFLAIYTGHDPSSTACRAQRVAPFVLQAIFNLILFAIAKVLMVVSDRARKFDDTQKRVYNSLLILYCVGLPIACLVAAQLLDYIETDKTLASSQMATQAAICTPRFPSQTQEFVVVFVPYILTGFIVVILSGNVAMTLIQVQNKTKEMHVSKNASSVALQQLILRLAILGVCTLVVLIVVIVSSSVASAQLTVYTPKLAHWWGCVSTCRCPPCSECTAEKTDLVSLKPDVTDVEVQVCAMSMITVLLGGFFTAQSVSRISKEMKDGSLKKKINNLCCRNSNNGINTTSNGSAQKSPLATTGKGSAAVATEHKSSFHMDAPVIAAYNVPDS